MSSRTSSGVAFRRRLQRIELMLTLLPEPVCPATRRWGIAPRSSTIGAPATSRPSATVSLDGEPRKIAVSTTSRSETRPTAMFGTSIPTTLLPGIGASMRSVRAASASARLSLSDSTRDRRMPGAIFSSYRVTTGPGVTSTTLAAMLKCASVCSMTSALLRISLLVPA
jgi:hypothetical protein